MSTSVTSIYSAVIAHCNGMSTDSNGRIGFGQVPPTAGETDAKKMAPALLSERFVLLAPHGVAGAVAGRIGSLQYFESPTFKTISGIDGLSRALPLEEQSGLLSAFVVPVVEQRGRGVIVLRGITTDGDQISVRRIADRAVRGVKTIGELFIGKPNSEDGRGALKQKADRVPRPDGKGKRSGALRRWQRAALLGRCLFVGAGFRRWHRSGRHRGPSGSRDRLHLRHHRRPGLRSEAP
jgi:hypothetical protein